MKKMKLIRKLKQKIDIEINKHIHPKAGSLNWAIIGTGPMSAHFCKALILSEKSNVIAVSSRSINKAEVFAKQFNIKNTFDNYEKLIEIPEIDIVYIATPVFTHFEITNFFLENRINVLVEKPMTYSADEANRLVQVAKKNKVFLMEGMWSKCLPTFQRVVQYSQEKTLGNLVHVKVDLSKIVPIDQDRVEFTNEYGGVLFDYGIYPISLVTHFLEGDIEIKNLSKRNNYLGIDSTWHIELVSKSITANISISSEYNGSQSCAFYFERGIIVLPKQFNRTNVIEFYDNQNNFLGKEQYSYIFDGFEYQINEVFSLINEGKLESSLVSHNSSLKSLKLMEDIYNYNLNK